MLAACGCCYARLRLRAGEVFLVRGRDIGRLGRAGMEVHTVAERERVAGGDRMGALLMVDLRKVLHAKGIGREQAVRADVPAARMAKVFG